MVCMTKYYFILLGIIVVLGFSSPPVGYAAFQTPMTRTQTPLPNRIDLSSEMPPVQNQGESNSCVAFTLGYYYKSFLERREHGWDYTTETVFSPSYIYNQIVKGSNESIQFDQAFKILQTQGIAPHNKFPTNSSDRATQPNELQHEAARKYRIDSYKSITYTGGSQLLQLLKEHLATKDPIAIGFPIPSLAIPATKWTPAIGLHTPTVIDLTDGSELIDWYSRYNHAVLLVGYDDATQRFKFINSWGEKWGEKGYGYLTYQYIVEGPPNIEAWTMVDAIAPKPAMRLYSLPDFPRLKPGERGEITIKVQNTGAETWPAGERLLFQRKRGSDFGIPSPLRLHTDILSDATLQFTLPVQAPMTPGVYDSAWRFSYDGSFFGDEIPITVIVIPEQSDAGFGDTIAAFIAQQRQQLEQSFAEAWAGVRAEIERQIQREFQRQLYQATGGLCGVAPAALIFAGGISWWRRRRR